jgi:PhzF family phenazine biosynthesis protein
MKKVRVYHYDAFSREANKGNPAGVVFNGDELTDEEMQQVARKVGFNETTFVQSSSVADVRLRFFTPGHEMNLCGHATMATTFALFERGMLGSQVELIQETKAGLLPIQIDRLPDHNVQITMKQASPQFMSFDGSVEELAQSMGLSSEEIDSSLPIVYGSTGIWTLLVPIKKLASFYKMTPDNKQFPLILKENPRSSVHPFCLETIDQSATMHARHFSSPYSGTIEDPVTGTASGAMGAYLATYIKPGQASYELIVEQGQEMGRDGRVMVRVSKQNDTIDVFISGNAVFVDEFEIEIEDMP